MSSELNASVLQALQDLERLRGESDSFFDGIRKEVTRTFGGLSDRITAMEAALRAAQLHSTKRAVSDEAAAAGAAAVMRLKDPSSHGLSFEALLEEVDADHRMRTAGSKGLHSAAPSTPTAPALSVSASQRAALDNSSSHFLVHGTAQTPGARHGVVRPDDRLDLSDGSLGATPVRRTPPDGDGGRGLKSSSSSAWTVFVEFKRGRVLQFESDIQVAPGEYVVVGGDRGEDIGLVVHSNSSASPMPPTPHKQNSQLGVGKVMRVATALEVAQLQGVQAELENRAKEVAQLKVMEHQLPMRIVDAEYQFDRKKLTFFYQSQHRLDFRVLVRDLYKTFRARIWMELE